MQDETSLEPVEAPPAEEDVAPLAGDASGENTDSRYGEKYVAAELRDRAAAFVIDILVLVGIGLTAANVMTYLTHPAWNGIPELSLFHYRLLWGAMGLFGFLYFFILEGALGATVGKMLCHLKIATKRGDYPSIVAVAVRNVLRPVELLLAPILTLPVMEWTHYHQRPADYMFGTIVIRRLPDISEETSIDYHYASATSRVLASIVGGVLMIGLVGAVLLNVATGGQRWLPSVVALNLLPAVLILYKIVLNTTCESDLVGWFFGQRLVSETGGPITFSGALLRALLFPLDLLGAGYPAMLLSPRHQRLGDFLGGTAVIRGRVKWYKGIVPLVLTLLLTAGLGYTGLRNRTNFFRTPVTINFSNQWMMTFPDPDVVQNLKQLIIKL